MVAVEEAEEDLVLELVNMVKKVAQTVQEEYGAFRVLTNLGQHQDSKHLHWHVAHGESLS
ncbi:HIT domain-containing protein [Pontibacillus salicampi]|uniref:HIT domain-containing protein n=1 Tax=Pontibacillus salicampi TaxID=1449801 RepID=A0ABV6LKH1_9BACI